MPFGNNGEYQGGSDESEYVYLEIICPGIRAALETDTHTPTIFREMDRNSSGSITTSIVKNLVEADIVVVDITGRNPNVFLELGMRYALRNKITILLSQAGSNVPFDIAGYRHIEYNRFRPRDAIQRLAEFIREGLQEQTVSDSPVFDVFRTLTVLVPGVLHSHNQELSNARSVLPWDDYINRIQWAIQLMKEPVEAGRFAPDLIIGISNGGLIVADLIWRSLFKSKPIVALWAKRDESVDVPNRYFNNPFNLLILEAIRRYFPEGHVPTLLLVDDHFGTGRTANQAIAFMREKLGTRTKVLYIPLVARHPEYLAYVEEYLPYNYKHTDGQNVFDLQRDEFIRKTGTSAMYFPYLDKEIRR